MKINLNDSVRIQIYEDGFEVMKNKYEKVCSPDGKPSRILNHFPWVRPDVDEEGYTKMQLHEIMYYFGEEMYLGNSKRLFNFNIELD